MAEECVECHQLQLRNVYLKLENCSAHTVDVKRTRQSLFRAVTVS